MSENSRIADLCQKMLMDGFDIIFSTIKKYVPEHEIDSMFDQMRESIENFEKKLSELEGCSE